MATQEEVQKLIDMARAAGLKRLKVDGVEFEFAGTPLPAGPRTSRQGRPAPTAEDFLLWSTGEPLSEDLQRLARAEAGAQPDLSPTKG